jgi:hypothetical protein
MKLSNSTVVVLANTANLPGGLKGSQLKQKVATAANKHASTHGNNGGMVQQPK